jgi:hypothetical protein
VDLFFLQTGLCVHFLQRRRQESLRINFAGHQFLGPSGSNEVYIRNAHESKDGAQILCDADYENGGKAGPSLGLPAAGRRYRGGGNSASFFVQNFGQFHGKALVIGTDAYCSE